MRERAQREGFCNIHSLPIPPTSVSFSSQISSVHFVPIQFHSTLFLCLSLSLRYIKLGFLPIHFIVLLRHKFNGFRINFRLSRPCCSPQRTQQEKEGIFQKPVRVCLCVCVCGNDALFGCLENAVKERRYYYFYFYFLRYLIISFRVHVPLYSGNEIEG